MCSTPIPSGTRRVYRSLMYCTDYVSKCERLEPSHRNEGLHHSLNMVVWDQKVISGCLNWWLLLICLVSRVCCIRVAMTCWGTGRCRKNEAELEPPCWQVKHWQRRPRCVNVNSSGWWCHLLKSDGPLNKFLVFFDDARKQTLFITYRLVHKNFNKKVVLSQGNRAMPQLFFSV